MVALVTAWLCAVLLFGRTAPAQYAGSQTCRSCHPAQYSSQSASAHARALQPATFPGVHADWAFGAGVQAVTFVSRLNEDFYVEQGLSFYSSIQGLALTPGHRNSGGERLRIFDPGAAVLRCFQCHSTGPLRLAAGYRIETSENGVHCEACHGPGERHAAGKGSPASIRNPGRLTPTEINRHCGQCHRMPAAAGDDTDWLNPWNARHQPLYLAESLCFQKSGQLSCLTCHDPHSSTRPPEQSYDARCATCHRQVRHTVRTANRSCVSCHMPAVRPIDPLKFSNHRIAVYGEGEPLRPTVRARSSLPARATGGPRRD